MKRIRDILSEMRVLLVKSGHDGQAKYIRTLLEAGEQDEKELRKGLVTVDMWGGAGAVWEVLPFNSPEERRQFSKLIVELEAAMRNIGIMDPRAQDVADTFKYWLNQGLI